MCFYGKIHFSNKFRKSHHVWPKNIKRNAIFSKFGRGTGGNVFWRCGYGSINMIEDIVAIDIRNDDGFLRKVIVFC